LVLGDRRVRPYSSRSLVSDTAADLVAMYEAAEAERSSPRSLEPAEAALREFAAYLGDLVGRFGAAADCARPTAAASESVA